MSDKKLLRCPCGRIPKELHIYDAGQGGKWANVSGSCCDEWTVEFRTLYYDLSSGECMTEAVKAWNEATRDKCL